MLVSSRALVWWHIGSMRSGCIWVLCVIDADQVRSMFDICSTLPGVVFRAMSFPSYQVSQLVPPAVVPRVPDLQYFVLFFAINLDWRWL